MQSEERRREIIKIIKESREPVPGSALSSALNVSRQIIVQDIALLRASNCDIISTTKGYILNLTKESNCHSAEFKVKHTDEQIEKELQLIVDLGGTVKDVFIKHEVYGTMRAELNIRSRRDVQKFLEDMENGKSEPLKNVTSGYHYHTVTADNEETLQVIEQALTDNGFLINYQN